MSYKNGRKKNILITKEEYKKYLDLLLTDCDLNTEEGLSKLGLQSFHFLAENYLNLDPEMEAFTDKIIDNCKDQFESVLMKTPDSAETRKVKRIFRALKNELPSAEDLIKILMSEPKNQEPILIDTGKLFEKYFQHYLDYLFDISYGQSHRGYASFAKLSMFYSITDELLVAFHMAQHSFTNQAYAHIRTVHECLNLIELFIRDESYAELWFSDDETRKKKELIPVVVRKKLGIIEDPLYAFYSVHGQHVTNKYVQSRSAKSGKLSEKGNPQFKYFIGGTRILSHRLWANVGCIIALSLVIIQLNKSFPTRVCKQDYESLLESFFCEYVTFLQNYIGFRLNT